MQLSFNIIKFPLALTSKLVNGSGLTLKDMNMEDKDMIETPISDWDKNLRTYNAMRKLGGSFMQALAEAWLRGDKWNRAKIEAAWVNDWKKYEEYGERNHHG